MNGIDENTRLLRIIVRLLCLQVTSGEMPRSDRERPEKEKIRILAGAGMSAGEIADLLGTTPNTVSVALSNTKREKQAKRAKAKGSRPLKALPAPEPDNGAEIVDES